MRMILRRWLRLAGAALLCSLLAACGGPEPAAAPAVLGSAAGAPAALPADVQAFKARRDTCDHFRGEEPYDAARAKFLADAMNKNCRGTDNVLQELRRRYATNPAVLAALQDYEDRIE